MYDLVVRGGTVVTAGTEAICDVGVADGRIAQLGGPMQGRREIDARGLYVLPGGVDVHVHLTSPVAPAPGVEVRSDDFYTGSLAALAGGITTVGNMAFQRPGERLQDALDRDLAAARQDAAVDYLLHPVLTDPTPGVLDEIAHLAAAGHTSLKIFMVTEQFDARIDAYIEAMRRAGAAGMLTLVHCEDGALVRCAGRALLAAGRGAARFYPDSRPVWSEAAAVERAVAMARAVAAPLYVVHLSSAAALAACRRARADGVPVFVETRPMYLHLTRAAFDAPDAARLAGAPPLRDAADVRALWGWPGATCSASAATTRPGRWPRSWTRRWT